VRDKIHNLKNRILSDSLAKGIFIIAGGTFIAQVISVLITPIITRLYTPADFGVLGLFTASLTLLALAGGFQYDVALPLPKDDEDAANLFIFFFFVLVITSICFFIILVLFGETIAQFFNISELKSYLFLLLIGFIGVSIYGALSSWVSRRRAYTCITNTKISQSLGGSTCKIIFGYLSVGPIGLIIGTLISHILGIGTLLRYMWKNDRVLFKNLSYSRMIENAKRYIQFPLFSFPSAIINAIAFQLPIFMISAIYGLNVAGMYSLAYAVLILTSSLISTSMGQVYYAEASNMIRENSKDIKNMYISTTRKLLLLAIPFIMIPCLLAPFVFPLVFGSAWNEAGWYCFPLAIFAIANFVISPTTFLGGYGFNHWALIFHICRTSLVFIGFYIVQILSLSIISALFIYSTVMAFMYIVLYYMNLRAISLFLKTELKSGKYDEVKL
jgi:O-antigen/teichoic acid export membrane protein